MRVDMHVHLIPASLAAESGFPPQTPEELWTACRAGGAELAVIQGWPFRDMAACRAQNLETLAALRQYPERFRGFAAVTPAAGEAALREAEACLDAGFSGVGELDPVRQGFSLEDAAFRKLCDLCEERGRPLCLHIDVSVGGEGNGPLPAAYLRLIERHPNLRLLLPHYGGGLPFYALMPEVAKQLGNVWFDAAPEDCALPPRAAACTRLCLGADRLVYGSHLPGAVRTEERCWDLPAEWEEWL